MADIGIEKKLDLTGFADKIGRQMVGLIAADCNREAKKKVRVDSNQLRNTIRTDAPSRDVREVVAATDHALAQEYGRADIRSQEKETSAPKSGRGGPYTFTPYMRPAAATASDEANLSKRAKEAGDTVMRQSRT